MKKNVIIKVFTFIILIIILSLYFTPTTLAVLENPVNDYKPGSNGLGGAIVNKGNVVFGLIRVIGTIISVIALMAIGIKYVIGSVEEKAEYKKTLGPYLIGAVLLFGASNIVEVLYDWAQSL